MPNFIFKVIDPQTRQYTSVNITAATQSEANRLVLTQGYSPVEVKEVKEKKFSLRSSRVKRKDKIVFTTQMSTLINAGLPLLESLKSAVNQVNSRELKRVTSEAITDIEAGIPFSEALAKHPNVFDNIFINLIKAGETSGTLDVSLDRLAVQQEKDGELAGKVKGAMVYPVIVIVVMIAVVVFMLIMVLPKVQTFYDDIDAELPFITRALLSMSDALRNFWYLFVIGVAGAMIGLVAWTRSLHGKKVLDHAKLQFPLIKSLYSRIYMARFTRTVGTLFGSGVNLIDSLNIIRTGINNMHLESDIGQSIKLVEEGHPLSTALESNPHFLDLVPNMIRIGEQSGKTEEMLMKAAVYYENEVDKQLKSLTTLIEPILIVTLGGVAMVIVLAILLPIYSLVNQNLT